MTHEQILIATDDSEPAQKAIGEAITMAEAFDATLHALHVLETAEPTPTVGGPDAERSGDTIAEQSLNRVVSEANEHGLEQDVVSATARGQPASEILNYASAHDIDLIVVGTHAREGIDRLLVGSVAERVIRDAPVPVVTLAMNS